MAFSQRSKVVSQDAVRILVGPSQSSSSNERMMPRFSKRVAPKYRASVRKDLRIEKSFVSKSRYTLPLCDAPLPEISRTRAFPPQRSSAISAGMMNGEYVGVLNSSRTLMENELTLSSVAERETGRYPSLSMRIE